MPTLQKQCFVVARLADYCNYRYAEPLRTSDPLFYLTSKLKELEPPMYQLKQEILSETVGSFFKKAQGGALKESDLIDFRQILDRFLSPGDFADASFHLTLEALADPERRKWAADVVGHMRAHQLLQEESKPEAERSRAWEKLVSELYRRLRFDLLERILKHKPLTRRRLMFALRRCRRNSYDYCGVVHLPLHADDTFTPFILPRVEALVAANRRFLRMIGG